MNHHNSPLVSIITPCYNSESFLADTITSVIDQTYPNWELLVVDDSSKDSSVEIIEKFAKSDSRVKPKYLSKNSGRIFCRNLAIKHAKGKYIILLDSDDIWYNDILKESINVMEKENIDFLFSSYDRYVVSKKKIINPRIAPSIVTISDICKSNPISCLTAIYNCENLGKRYFLEEFEREDLVYWISILKDTKFAFGNQKILARYNIRKGSTSGNKIKMLQQQWQVYRRYLGFSIPKSIYFSVFYSINGIINYRKVFLRWIK